VFGLVLLACAGSGCGATQSARLSSSDYLEHLRAIEAGPAARTASRLFFRIVVDPGAPKAQCAAMTRRFHRNIAEIVDEVAALNPPRDVEALQRRFVSAARESVGVVGRASRDVEVGRLRCGRPMNRRIYGLPSTRRAEQVLTELAHKGYVIGSNSD
jgi:hypothetical protein